MRKSQQIAWLQMMLTAQHDEIKDLLGMIKDLVSPSVAVQNPYGITPSENGGPQLMPDPPPEWEDPQNWEPANWADLVEIEGVE